MLGQFEQSTLDAIGINSYTWHKNTLITPENNLNKKTTDVNTIDLITICNNKNTCIF